MCSKVEIQRKPLPAYFALERALSLIFMLNVLYEPIDVALILNCLKTSYRNVDTRTTKKIINTIFSPWVAICFRNALESAKDFRSEQRRVGKECKALARSQLLAAS